MSRLASCLLLVLSLLTLSAGAARADDWTCTYSGRWTRSSDGGAANFTWQITWRKADGGWRLVGDYQDLNGSSRFDGRCANKSCRFHQRYIGGKLDGKTYHYQGSYQDTWYGDSKTVNQFTGTWGYNSSAQGDGSWTATATCVKL